MERRKKGREGGREGKREEREQGGDRRKGGREAGRIEKVEEGLSPRQYEVWERLVSGFDFMRVGKLFHLLGPQLSPRREWWCWNHAPLVP